MAPEVAPTAVIVATAAAARGWRLRRDESQDISLDAREFIKRQPAAINAYGWVGTGCQHV